LAQRQADPCPAGGPKPWPVPAPPPAGASTPPGRALTFVFPGPAGLKRSVPRGRGKRDAFPIPAGTDDSTLTASMAGAIAPATAPRWHQARPGAQSPRPAPAPPSAGASRPPGRALASVSPGPAGLQGTVARGRGKRDAFPVPARTGEGTLTAAMAGAIAPATVLRCPLPSRGPKPPASARPATGGRFAPAGSGAGLSLFPDLPVYGAPSRAGRGNAGRVS